MKGAIVVTSLVSFLCGCAVACPNGFTNLKGGCYHFSAESANFLNATRKCAEMGAALVSIETEQESEVILSHMLHLKAETKVNPSYWISLSDVYDYRNFMWTSTWKPLTYTNWCKGEPNDYEDMDERCVEMKHIEGGKTCWNDNVCTKTHTWDSYPFHYICEKNSGKIYESKHHNHITYEIIDEV